MAALSMGMMTKKLMQKTMPSGVSSVLTGDSEVKRIGRAANDLMAPAPAAKAKVPTSTSNYLGS